MTAIPAGDVTQAVQRQWLRGAGVVMSPEFERALWPLPNGERPKEKIVTGGVQAGKSTEGAAEVFIDLPLLDYDRAEPYRYWFIMPSYQTPKTEVEYLIDWCRSFHGTDTVRDHLPEGGAAVVDLFGGRVIVETRTSRETEGIAARAVDGVVVCEAGQQPEAVRTAALERTITRRGWVTYTGTLEDDEAKPRYAWYDTLAQKWRDDWSEGVAVSLPTWANVAKFPLGRADPYIVDRESRLRDFPGVFEQRFGGIPTGSPNPVYGELLSGDWDSAQLGKVEYVKPQGAGGYDYGTTPGHPSTLVAVQVTTTGIVVVVDAWEDYGGDVTRNENKRREFSHEYGISLHRWGFDPMLRESAIRAGATPMEDANLRRLERVGKVKARHNAGRLYYNLANPMVRKLLDKMRQVHYQKRSSPAKGDYYEYHRSDDDLPAALENAVTVIDTQATLPASYREPAALGRRRAPVEVRLH